MKNNPLNNVSLEEAYECYHRKNQIIILSNGNGLWLLSGLYDRPTSYYDIMNFIEL